MKNGIIAKFIDTVLIFIVTAFFSIAVAGYFLRSFYQIIAAGLTCAICLTALIGMAQRKKRKISNPLIRDTLTQFIYSDERYAYNFIKSALGKKYTVSGKRTWLKVNNTTAVFVRLKTGKLDAKTLSELYGKVRNEVKKIIILTIDGADKDASALINILPDPVVNVFDGEKVYSLLKWLNAMPPIEFKLKVNKTGIKDFFKNAVQPANARGYFFTAFILITSSLILSRSIYYLIAASVCLTLGILSKIDLITRLKKRKNP